MLEVFQIPCNGSFMAPLWPLEVAIFGAVAAKGWGLSWHLLEEKGMKNVKLHEFALSWLRIHETS